MAAPEHSRLVLLLLLLTMMVPQLVTQKTIRECLGPNAAILQCDPGQAILVDHAFLGASEGTTSPQTYCPKTSDECHTPTPRVATLCNRHQTCSLAYPSVTVINLYDGCGLTNYIEATYRCVQISTVISICGWSGERGAGTGYIVNNNYPLAIQPQPHRCQCIIQRPPHSTDLQTGVTLIVRDAYFTGSNCQQKLYVEFPGNSTQSSTVCSSSTRVTGRTIFSRSSIQNGEIIALTFHKSANIGDAGTFVIELQVTGLVFIKCTTTTIPAPTPPTTSTTSTSSLTTSTTSTSSLTTSKTSTDNPASNNTNGSFQSTAATPWNSLEQRSETTASTSTMAPSTVGSGKTIGEHETEQLYIIAGAASGGAALILIILIAALVIRCRRKRRRQPHKEAEPPQAFSNRDSDQPTVKDNKDQTTTGSTNKGDTNPTANHFTDDIQMYADIPEEENNLANHSKEEVLKDDSPKAASRMEETTFTDQAPDLNLPTEEYATVDMSKKSTARGEVTHNPDDYINVGEKPENPPVPEVLDDAVAAATATAADDDAAVVAAAAASSAAASAAAEDPVYDEAVECRLVRPKLGGNLEHSKVSNSSHSEETASENPQADVTGLEDAFCDSPYDTVITENELYDQ